MEYSFLFLVKLRKESPCLSTTSPSPWRTSHVTAAAMPSRSALISGADNSTIAVTFILPPRPYSGLRNSLTHAEYSSARSTTERGLNPVHRELRNHKYMQSLVPYRLLLVVISPATRNNIAVVTFTQLLFCVVPYCLFNMSKRSPLFLFNFLFQGDS